MPVSTKARLYFFLLDVRQAFTRLGFRLEDSLSFETVKKHLSLKDAAKLVAMGRVLEMMPVFAGIEVGSDFLTDWRESTRNEADLQQISIIELMSREDKILIEIRADLSNPDKLAPAGGVEPFKIELFAAQAIGITFHQGALADLLRNPVCSHALLRSIVKNLCVYEPYGAVMARPLGLRYIESL